MKNPSADPAPVAGNSPVLLQPHEDFENRTYTRFGIGEFIDLSPADPGAYETRRLRWVKTGGSGTLYNHAGERGKATLTSCAAGTTRLELRDRDSNAVLHTVDVYIVVPIAVKLARISGTGIKHTKDTWSVGFKGGYTLQPSGISFAGILFRLGACPAVTTGFLNVLNANHPTSEAFTIDNDKVDAVDTVFSGQLRSPYSPGTFLWSIPAQYSADNGRTWTTFDIVNHYATSDANGTATITKGSCGPFTKIPTDPTSTY